MAQITDYTTLAAAIDDWDERDHDADELIGLAEGEFRLYFGPNFVKETSSALTFTSGVASLPSGFVRPLALVHATLGDVPFRSIAAVRAYNYDSTAGDPVMAAITGSSIVTAPLYTGSATLSYEGTLTGLTSNNATNWLITNAPQAYLSMCLYFGKAKYEDPTAPGYKATALQTLADLGIQAVVAQYGRVGMTIRGSTP